MPVDDRELRQSVRPGRRLATAGGMATAVGMAGLAAVVLLLGPGSAIVPGGAAGPAIGPARVFAASPAASPAAGGDTRSPGEGPGLVGSPLLAIGGVLALGLAAAALTLLYVRATGGPRPPP